MVNATAPIKCVKCDLGMHEDCYSSYHKVREGVVLDLTYEINKVRRSHKSSMQWNRKTVRYHPRRVQPDIHNDEEVPGNNSQDDCETGDWESTSDESEKGGETDKSDDETGKDSC